MRYRTDGCGLDLLTTPIILCGSDGMVIYKNDIAVKQIRLPRRHTDMKTHLSGDERGTLAEIARGSRTGVLTVYTGDRNAKAFVSAYERDGVNCTLWVFPAFLQLNPSSSLFSALEKDLRKLGTDVCAVIKYLDKQATVSSGRSRNALRKRIGERMEHLLEDLFSGRTERANWPVGESVDILREQISTIFAEHGYQIECCAEMTKEHRKMFLNFRDFIAFYSHALTFCCEITRNRRINLDIRPAAGKEALEFRIRLTLLFPPLFVENESDLTKMMPYFPDHHVEILLFNKLAAFCGYEVSYSLSDSHHDNVEFLFRVPLTFSRGISTQYNSDREARRVRIDCDNILQCYLDYSNHRFESEAKAQE